MSGLAQLWRTWNQYGLEPKQGMGIRAISAGVDPRSQEIAEVEALLTLRPPPGCDWRDVPDPFVVESLVWSRTPHGEVLARKRYIGKDAGGRDGNYFVHAVVGDLAELSAGEAAALATSEFWKSDTDSIPANVYALPGVTLKEIAEQTPAPAPAVWCHQGGVTVSLLSFLIEALLARTDEEQVVLIAPPWTIAAAVFAAAQALPRTLSRSMTFGTYAPELIAISGAPAVSVVGCWWFGSEQEHESRRLFEEAAEGHLVLNTIDGLNNMEGARPLAPYADWAARALLAGETAKVLRVARSDAADPNALRRRFGVVQRQSVGETEVLRALAENLDLANTADDGPDGLADAALMAIARQPVTAAFAKDVRLLLERAEVDPAWARLSAAAADLLGQRSAAALEVRSVALFHRLAEDALPPYLRSRFFRSLFSSLSEGAEAEPLLSMLERLDRPQDLEGDVLRSMPRSLARTLINRLDVDTQAGTRIVVALAADRSVVESLFDSPDIVRLRRWFGHPRLRPVAVAALIGRVRTEQNWPERLWDLKNSLAVLPEEDRRRIAEACLSGPDAEHALDDIMLLMPAEVASLAVEQAELRADLVLWIGREFHLGLAINHPGVLKALAWFARAPGRSPQGAWKEWDKLRAAEFLDTFLDAPAVQLYLAGGMAHLDALEATPEAAVEFIDSYVVPSARSVDEILAVSVLAMSKGLESDDRVFRAPYISQASVLARWITRDLAGEDTNRGNRLLLEQALLEAVAPGTAMLEELRKLKHQRGDSEGLLKGRGQSLARRLRR